MIRSALTRDFCTALVTCVPFGTAILRKREARLREEEQSRRDRQVARLESLKKRMQAEEEFATIRYPDLPHVRLAGLLAVPRDARVEPR